MIAGSGGIATHFKKQRRKIEERDRGKHKKKPETKRWCQSTLFPPIWTGFKSRRRRHTCVEIVDNFPLLREVNISSAFPFPRKKKKQFQIPIRPEVVRRQIGTFLDVLPQNRIF